MAEDIPPTPTTATTASASQGASPSPDATVTYVALIGRAGSGKSTVAHAVFGLRDEPTTAGVYQRYQDDIAPVVVDDIAGWVNGSESTLGVIFSYLEAARASDLPLGAIWYTLDASSARVTEYETRLIQRLARMYPVVVVLTRCDLVSASAVAAMRAAIEREDIPNVLGVVPIAADPLPALGVAPYGVKEIMAITPLRPWHAETRAEGAAEPVTPQPQAATTAHISQTDAGTRRAGASTTSGVGAGAQRDRAGGPYGAAEMDIQPSRALIALGILIPLAVILALALFFLGRRRTASEDELRA